MSEEINQKLDKIITNISGIKTDITGMKQEMTGMATKVELNKVLVQVINNAEDIKDIKKDIKELNNKMDKVLTSTDGLTKKVENSDAEHASNLQAHDRFEKRIIKLEANHATV